MRIAHALVIAVMLVVSMGATAQAQKAKPSTRKPASGQPKPAQQIFYDGFEAYKANRFQDAIGLFEQGLQRDPTNALAAFYLGEAYGKTGNQGKAQQWYAASVATDPQSEVAEQARTRLAAAQRGAAAPTPSPATQGPAFDETLAFIRETLALYGEFTRPSPDGNQSVYWVFNVKSIDIISDIIIINTEQRRVEMGNGEKQLLYKAKFSIFDISRVFLERRAKGSSDVIGVTFLCKDNKECIDQESTRRGNSNKTFFEIEDIIQAEKIMKAFKHLFSLRGWQEKKDLF